MGGYGIMGYNSKGLVMGMKRLPIGISDFDELVKNDYYYVDTTRMIEDIYKDGSKILLLTRPRCFGKTLNMSMLNSKGTDPVVEKKKDILNIPYLGNQLVNFRNIEF